MAAAHTSKTCSSSSSSPFYQGPPLGLGRRRWRAAEIEVSGVSARDKRRRKTLLMAARRGAICRDPLLRDARVLEMRLQMFAQEVLEVGNLCLRPPDKKKKKIQSRPYLKS